MPDIFALREQARAGDFANRAVKADPDLVSKASARLTLTGQPASNQKPRCRHCASILTVEDRGWTCRMCLRLGFGPRRQRSA